MLALALIRLVGGLGTWILYSQIVKMALQPAVRINTIVSQTRPEGNVTHLLELASTLPDTKHVDAFLYTTSVWGGIRERATSDSSNATNTCNNSRSSQPVKKLGKYLILKSSNGSGTNNAEDNYPIILASCKVPKESLRMLVQSKPIGKLVTEPFTFRVWMEALADTVPATTSFRPHGTYYFTFRDYWNFEEAMGMELSYGSIRMLKLRRKGHSQLNIDVEGNCTLTEGFYFNGFIPMYITWEGRLSHDTITWTHTMIRKGWSRIGTTIDSPPIAERLRQQPWYIRMPSNDDSGDLLVLERKDIGRLVFARGSVFP